MPRYQAAAQRPRLRGGAEIYRGDGDTPGREDLKKTRGRVRQLSAEDWQNRRVALQRGGREPWGKARFKRASVHTRLYLGACIFHNRVDHSGGAGCAFHVAAPRRGENPMDRKPRTCWHTPLFFDTDDKTKTTMVHGSRTADCGGEGILEWWCTEDPDAFSADQPVYLTMEQELRRVWAPLSTTFWPPAGRRPKTASHARSRCSQ